VISSAKPDVLICDIGMPGQDGYELIRQVRQLPEQQHGSIPAVALTAYSRREDVGRAITAGYQGEAPTGRPTP
jgi:CheY-like chemotaxis protein